MDEPSKNALVQTRVNYIMKFEIQKRLKWSHKYISASSHIHFRSCSFGQLIIIEKLLCQNNLVFCMFQFTF